MIELRRFRRRKQPRFCASAIDELPAFEFPRIWRNGLSPDIRLMFWAFKQELHERAAKPRLGLPAVRAWSGRPCESARRMRGSRITSHALSLGRPCARRPIARRTHLWVTEYRSPTLPGIKVIVRRPLGTALESPTSLPAGGPRITSEGQSLGPQQEYDLETIVNQSVVEEAIAQLTEAGLASLISGKARPGRGFNDWNWPPRPQSPGAWQMSRRWDRQTDCGRA